jgi:hypothetical protein
MSIRSVSASAVLLALIGGMMMTPRTTAGDIGYVEDFALAKDRPEALKQLIPGTDDYYYYHCLHYLNTEQFEKVEPLTKLWHERHNQTPRLTEIQTRYALLTYDRDPKKSLEYVRWRLGVQFNHQKETVGAVPNLPTALDPKLIARDTLKASSLARWGNLDNFEDAALDWLAAETLTWQNRRQLVTRLQRPDVSNVVNLIAEDLKAEHAQAFGSYAVHKQLTVPQLEALLKPHPILLNDAAFVTAYITKLQPGADDDWRRNRASTRAYLDRLWAFVSRLSAVHNPLKAHVLYHRLAFDRAEGKIDRDRFLTYLKLPRQQGYMAKRLLESREAQNYPANLTADYSATTLLPPVGSDEQLVRSYLAHLLADANGTAEFEPFVNDVYLRHLFAETKLTLGLGDGEKWASLLPPELLQALKDRVDIDFAFTNKTEFAVDEPVVIDLFVKNAPTLLVKVFEINTRNFYRTHQREIDTDINLDGLVPNAEFAIPGGGDPFRRTAVSLAFPDANRKIPFPAADRPGVYVIDFIGGGKSSRALVRKGSLRPLVVTGSAGQKVSVVDEKNRPVPDATVWVGGQEYTPGADGSVLVPFSTSPGRRPVILSRGEFSSLDHIDHQPEHYALTAGLHIDRESLLTQRLAQVMVRPGVSLNGKPVSVSVLDDVQLRITSTDLDGIPTSTEVPNFKLFEDRESTHDFRVPPRTANLYVALTAKVKSLSTGQTIDLATARSFPLNGIDRTDKTEDLHLAKFGPDYVIELLGRTGEAKPDRSVNLQLKHRDFREPVSVSLKTDAKGRVLLGPLPDIVNVTATGPEGLTRTWPLPTDRHTYRQVLHAKAGDTVRLPYLGKAGQPTRDELALFEVNGSVIRADRFDAIAITNGVIELKGLTAGDYDLWLKRSGEKVRIRVAAGEVSRGFILGQLRHLQQPALPPVQIESIVADADGVTVKVRDFSKFTRLHVFATRYRPEFSPYSDLATVRDAELSGVYPGHADSVYLTGRNIGDEYRYVLERRDQKKYPGNMLARPELLLNPWAIRSTATGEQEALSGDRFAGKSQSRPAERVMEPKAEAPAAPAAVELPPRDLSPDLDFLFDSSAVAVNLLPDENGLLKLSRKGMGPHAWVHVVAVDPLNTTYRSVSLPEVPATFADLRLKSGLDPAKHFTQQKQVTLLDAGKPFTLDDPAGSRFETYDSLTKVHGLYATLSKDPKLAEFAFVLRWSKLKAEEKRELYSKHACHELNFFLHQKDAEFFAGVVKPYLANKKDKTFLDHWLLDADMGRYVEPWHYGRLNIPERVLLARRVENEPAKTARHLSDLLKLLPPSTDRDLYLYDVAVVSSALDDLPAGRPGMPAKPATSLNLPADAPAFPAGAAPAPGPTGGAGGMMGGMGGGGGGRGFGGPGGPPAKGDMAKDAKLRDGSGGESRRELLEKKAEDKQIDEVEKSKEMGDRFYDQDRKKAEVARRRFYRQVEPTMEWAENNYYKLPIQAQLADLVSVSPFWADYAKHDGKGGFLSKHLPVAARNFTEMMFALAVLDLPFEAAKPEYKFDGGKMTYTPASRAVVFHEEVKPADGAGGQLPILVSQNFYRHGDRHRVESGETVDKFVTGEFVAQVVYGGQVVVTNPTSSRQKLSVLVQLPVGAIPLTAAKFTKAHQLDLEPYRTQTIDYLFYFPAAGRFPQFPVHVAKNEQFVAAAKPVEFNVLAKPSQEDTGSWQYVSQNGSTDDVLAYLTRENVRALNLDKIAFRMKDRGFFEAVVKLLQDRHLYHPTLYSYALFHADAAVAKQFLLHADGFVNEAGGPITSPLLDVDPVARHAYEHLEYKPLVNARAHALGKRRQIVNDRLHWQYHNTLKVLSYRTRLTDDDLLAVAYYLLLQDRIDEATDAFNRVSRDRVATRMQYDYCAAYLDLFTDDPRKARSIAMQYANHPVDRWRNSFAAILDQLDEIEGKGTKIADKDDRTQQQTQLAATEPSFEAALDGKTITLTHQNLEAVRVNYYPMDVELLFSGNPFVQQSGGQFATIRPNKSDEVKLAKGQGKTPVPLPAEFANKNVLVEITAAGKTRTVPYYATAMTVAVTENYGQLKVTEAAGKGLGKVYVKVYAKLADGRVKFHKDGYTDLRGRFDYATVSTPETQPVERFAVLVLSEDRGAMIREVAPPQR